MRKFRVGVTEARRELIVQAGAALGALLIVISLFLPWFSVGVADSVKALAQAGVQSEIDSAEELGEVSTEELGTASELLDSSIDFSGWSSLEFADALLLFVAIAAAMLALGRRRGEPETKPREAGDALLLLGLLAVVTVLVLLFTKNSLLGMLGSSIDFALDKAAELGQPAADIELLDISAGPGLWLGLLGSLLTLVAGFFHGLVDPTGVEGPRSAGTTTTPAATTTTPAAGTEPTTTTTTPEAPTTPQPHDPGSRPPGTA